MPTRDRDSNPTFVAFFVLSPKTAAIWLESARLSPSAKMFWWSCMSIPASVCELTVRGLLLRWRTVVFLVAEGTSAMIIVNNIVLQLTNCWCWSLGGQSRYLWNCSTLLQGSMVMWIATMIPHRQCQVANESGWWATAGQARSSIGYSIHVSNWFKILTGPFFSFPYIRHQ